MQRASFAIADMSCGACVSGVTAVLNRLGGVRVEQVSIGSAEVTFDPAQTSPIAIAEALSAAGYPARQRETPAA